MAKKLQNPPIFPGFRPQDIAKAPAHRAVQLGFALDAPHIRSGVLRTWKRNVSIQWDFNGILWRNIMENDREHWTN